MRRSWWRLCAQTAPLQERVTRSKTPRSISRKSPGRCSKTGSRTILTGKEITGQKNIKRQNRQTFLTHLCLVGLGNDSSPLLTPGKLVKPVNPRHEVARYQLSRSFNRFPHRCLIRHRLTLPWLDLRRTAGFRCQWRGSLWLELSKQREDPSSTRATG